MPADKTGKQAQGVNSVDHALRLITHLAERASVHGATMAELSEGLGLPRPTLYRLLATLQAHDLVVRVNKRYRLTLRLAALAQAAFSSSGIQTLCQPYLNELARQTGETTHFAILDGDRAGYIAKVDGAHAIRMTSHVGWRGPLHATAAGKILLAWSSEELRNAFLQGPLERFTACTLTEPEKLRAQIDLIKRQGYALDDQELLEGLVCVAAPVVADGWLVGAVSISGPTIRRQALLDAMPLVRTAADAIAAQLET